MMCSTIRRAAAIGLTACLAACTTAHPVPAHRSAWSAGAPGGAGGMAKDGAEAGTPAPLETTLPLDGEYIATFKAPLLGEVSGRLTAKPTRNGFTASTRPDVAWGMIGGLEGFFGSIFAGHIFPGGSILAWNSSLPHDGRPGRGTLGPGVKSAQVRTKMTSASGPVELYGPDDHRVGTMTIRPVRADETAGADYPALAASVERAFTERLYDASMLQSGQVRGYLRQLRNNAAASQDDVEFIFGAVVAGRNNIKFALPLVLKRFDPDWRTQLGGLKDAGMATLRVTYDDETGIATLKAEAFLDTADVDRAFEEVLSHNPRALVLDLRGCPGVTLASLRVVSWLIDAPVDAGTFFGAAARPSVKAGKLEDVAHAELSSAESVEAIEKLLDGGGAARVTILPAQRRFAGPVAVLTTSKTTTSTEALAWTLKCSGRARLFGSPTAGRPTLSRPVDIGQGWVVWMPSLDYRPPSGERTDRGCRPDVDSSSKERAKQGARAWLLEQAGPAEEPARPETTQ
jgi:hypothetical protein